VKDGVVGQCHHQRLVFFLLDSISSQTVLTNTSIRLVGEKQHLDTGCKYPFCTNIRHTVTLCSRRVNGIEAFDMLQFILNVLLTVHHSISV
jgi:hypothetical protein